MVTAAVNKVILMMDHLSNVSSVHNNVLHVHVQVLVLVLHVVHILRPSLNVRIVRTGIILIWVSANVIAPVRHVSLS